VDERVKELVVDMEVSVGDYILGGGETASMVIVDAISRLIPGVLGSAMSANDESFSRGFWSIRSIRDRNISGGAGSRKFFCPATTGR